MNRLHTKDTDTILRKLPRKIHALLKEFPGSFLAGGFIRSTIAKEPVADVDVFCISKGAATLMASKYKDGEDMPTHESDNAITIRGGRYKLQLIQRWGFDDPSDCLTAFDFTIACACLWWDGSGWKTACHDDYYADLAAKRLTYLSPKRDEEAAGSMMRVMKFLRRGYYIPQDSMGAVIARMVIKVDQAEDGRDMTEPEWAASLSRQLLDVYPSSRRAAE